MDLNIVCSFFLFYLCLVVERKKNAIFTILWKNNIVHSTEYPHVNFLKYHHINTYFHHHITLNKNELT